MKGIIFMLLMTCTASVFGQTNKDQLMAAVAESVGATQQNGIYVEGEVIGAGVINNSDKPLYTFVVHVPGTKKEKNPQAAVDAILGKISTSLKNRQEQLMIKVVMTETGFKRVPSGETSYYARPLHITSWCSGNFCSSTVYGGGIATYDRMKLAHYAKELAYAVWRNY